MRFKCLFRENGEVKTYHDKIPETKKPIFKWSNFFDEKSEILNSDWKIKESLTGIYRLIDPKGEVRFIEWGEYHEAVEHPSWKDYDTAKEIKELKRKIENLEQKNNQLQQENDLLQQQIKELRQKNNIWFPIRNHRQLEAILKKLGR